MAPQPRLVHLRTGDVLDGFDADTEELPTANATKRRRFVPPSYYARVAEDLRSKGYREVWLVTGTHWPSPERQRTSAAYIEAVTRRFREEGISCALLSQEADQDFAVRANADVLAPARGGRWVRGFGGGRQPEQGRLSGRDRRHDEEKKGC